MVLRPFPQAKDAYGLSDASLVSLPRKEGKGRLGIHGPQISQALVTKHRVLLCFPDMAYGPLLSLKQNRRLAAAEE